MDLLSIFDRNFRLGASAKERKRPTFIRGLPEIAKVLTQPRSDFIRTSIYDKCWGSMKSLHTWIMLVIVKQHMVQIGRVDGPIEY
jgi:hypothetical protein